MELRQNSLFEGLFQKITSASACTADVYFELSLVGTKDNKSILIIVGVRSFVCSCVRNNFH